MVKSDTYSALPTAQLSLAKSHIQTNPPSSTCFNLNSNSHAAYIFTWPIAAHGEVSHSVYLQVCPKHGTDFLEYKCRYCCSVAVYFCFGTTHFCNPCHDDFQRVTSTPKSELPQCPVGPRAKPLEGTECPLHVKHPPTGEEFALGCGVCRNAQTF